MEWTDERDVLMQRTIMVNDMFQFMKGMACRGEAREFITEKLNKIDMAQINIKEKRAVRDRWVLLQKKYKNKVRRRPVERLLMERRLHCRSGHRV